MSGWILVHGEDKPLAKGELVLLAVSRPGYPHVDALGLAFLNKDLPSASSLAGDWTLPNGLPLPTFVQPEAYLRLNGLEQLTRTDWSEDEE